jgi:hypothetical protein
MKSIEQECRDILHENGINALSSIEFDVNGEHHSLSYEYIIETYMQASDASKIVFLRALQKAVEAKEMGVEKFFEGMGQLLLMTHLSDKIEL